MAAIQILEEGEELNWMRFLVLSLNDQRMDMDTSDVSLIVEDQQIAAHKIILAASSPYLKAMFHGKFKESKESQVVIKDIDYASVKALIQFFYTAQIDITDENIDSLLKAATLMQVEHLINRCIQQLENSLSPANCVNTLNIADKYSFNQTKDIARDYIITNFSQVKVGLLVKLQLEHMIEIMRSEELIVDSELTVFHIAKGWVLQNNMDDKLADLLKHVRFSQMDLTTLARILFDPIFKSERCAQYAEEAMKFLVLPYNVENNPHKEALYARGSSICLHTFHSDTRGSGQKYNPTEDRWTYVRYPTPLPYESKMALLNNIIYFVGCLEDNSVDDRVTCYNPYSNMITVGTPLPDKRLRVEKLVSLGDYLYALTTIHSKSPIESVSGGIFRYHPDLREWYECCDTDVPKDWVFCCTVALNGYIYIAGPDPPYYSRLVERYNPQNDKWERMASMIHCRCHASCTTFGGHIYVVGGYDEQNGLVLSSGERYDPKKDEWELIAPMSKPRHNLSLVAMGDLIFAVGGQYTLSKSDFSKNLEAYDPVKNTWSLRSPMEYSEKVVGAVAIKGLKF